MDSLWTSSLTSIFDKDLCFLCKKKETQVCLKNRRNDFFLKDSLFPCKKEIAKKTISIMNCITSTVSISKGPRGSLDFQNHNDVL